MKIYSIFALSFLAIAQNLDAQVVINIDANERGPMISPTHYGIFYEDINHAADGGLYAELIRNRSFEDDSGDSSDIGYSATPDLPTEIVRNSFISLSMGAC